jgi:hypothetical protein
LEWDPIRGISVIEDSGKNYFRVHQLVLGIDNSSDEKRKQMNLREGE